MWLTMDIILHLLFIFISPVLSMDTKIHRNIADDGRESVVISRPKTMQFVPGGEFKMGVNDPSSKTGEYPQRKAEVKPFEIDIYPVTVKDFLNFKQFKARYKTTAEKAGYSYVFYTRASEMAIKDFSKVHPMLERWWIAVQGADWRRVHGVHDETYKRLDHPMIHVSYQDADIYCRAHKKRLPTEYEWEFAARGGLKEQRYPWGDRYESYRMNVWQGRFPTDNTRYDGYDGTAPVKAYREQNGYGLYDMVGNVWEWTSTPYHDRPYARNINYTALAHAENPRMTVKGGSFVDSRDGRSNYEARCAARHGYPANYTGESVGFRCVKSFYTASNPMPKSTPAPREWKVYNVKDTERYKRDHGIVDKGKSRLITFYDEVRALLRKMSIDKRIQRFKDEM